MNLERLGKLKRVLERCDDEAFDIRAWYCGTAACAAGHYAVSPEGIADGWTVEVVGKHNMPNVGVPRCDDGPFRLLGEGAIRSYFDLDYWQSRIFMPISEIYGNNNPSLGEFLRQLDYLMVKGEPFYKGCDE